MPQARRLYRINMACAAFTGGIASVTLAGYLLGRPPLASVYSSLTEMYFNTALCFLLCAAGLAALELRRSVVARLCPGIAAVAGLLALSQHVFGVNLRIDTLFAQPFSVPPGGVPGRMSFSSAISFTCVGIALASMAGRETLRNWHILLAAFLGSIAAASGLIALIGYFGGIDVTTLWGVRTRMAGTTATCFIILGSAVVIAAKRRSPDLPLWLPVPVFIAGAMVAAVLAQALRMDQYRALEATVRTETRHVADKLRDRLDESHRALNRHAGRWGAANGTPRPLWERDVRAYLDDYPFLIGMTRLAPESDERWTVLSDKFPPAMLPDLLRTTQFQEALSWAQATGGPRATPVLSRGEGPIGTIFAYVMPLWRDGRLDGALAVVFSMSELIDSVLPSISAERASISIVEAGQVLFSSLATGGAPTSDIEESILITNLGRVWSLVGAPTRALRAAIQTSAPAAISVAGTLIAALFASCVYMAVRRTGDLDKLQAHQDQLRLYADELERSNRELDQFAYAASHDLKAPLRVINNTSRWLEEDLGPYLSEEDKANMAMLRGRVERMQRLLDDLLEYSRLGRAKDNRFDEMVNGRALVTDILMLLSPPRNFEVVISPAFDDIQINRMPFQQVLYNLVGNAIKHHDKPQGRIELDVIDIGEFYRFSVRDDGPGIPEHFHQQAFKMFHTLKPRDQVEGSGMGLAFVKKSVEQVGGALELTSREGEGATFTITWPKTQKPKGLRPEAA